MKKVLLLTLIALLLFGTFAIGACKKQEEKPEEVEQPEQQTEDVVEPTPEPTPEGGETPVTDQPAPTK